MLAPEETASLKWGPADEEGVVAFLVGEKNFNEDRVRKTVQKLNASRSKATQGAFSQYLLPSAGPLGTAPDVLAMQGRVAS